MISRATASGTFVTPRPGKQRPFEWTSARVSSSQTDAPLLGAYEYGHGRHVRQEVQSGRVGVGLGAIPLTAGVNNRVLQRALSGQVAACLICSCRSTWSRRRTNSACRCVLCMQRVQRVVYGGGVHVNKPAAGSHKQKTKPAGCTQRLGQ